MKALVILLAAAGWAATAGAAYLLGMVHEHIESHDEGLYKKAHE